MQKSLTTLTKDHGLKAIFLGTRRTDPYSTDLDYMTKSSESWPDFVRVLPILDLGYRDIWNFLKEFDVPHCSLYHEGYTYLGDMSDSIKNPFINTPQGFQHASKATENYEPFSRKENFDKICSADGKVHINKFNFAKLVIFSSDNSSSSIIPAELIEILSIKLFALQNRRPCLMVDTSIEEIMLGIKSVKINIENHYQTLLTIQRDIIIERVRSNLPRAPVYLLFVNLDSIDSGIFE